MNKDLEIHALRDTVFAVLDTGGAHVAVGLTAMKTTGERDG